jgi:hypothetical protein
LDLYSTPWSIGAKVHCRPSHCEGVGGLDIALKAQASQGDWQPHHPAIPHVGKILIKVAQKGPCQENEREKTKIPLLHMLWNSWKETFLVIKRYKIEESFCVKETEGEGSRARGARQGEALTAYLWMCGNNSIETAPQRTGHQDRGGFSCLQATLENGFVTGYTAWILPTQNQQMSRQCHSGVAWGKRVAEDAIMPDAVPLHQTG